LELELESTSQDIKNKNKSDENFHIMGADDLIIEIDTLNFQKIMKKMDYAIVFLYNISICRNINSDQCKSMLISFKKASERLYRNKPAVGLFKIRCNNENENKNMNMNINSEKEKEKEEENICKNIDLKNEDLPHLLFVYHGGYHLIDKNYYNDSDYIFNEIQNKINLTSITPLDKKSDIKNIFEIKKENNNNSNIKSQANNFIFYPYKFIFYKIKGEKAGNNEIKDNRNLEKLFFSSNLLNTFKGYELLSKRVFEYFINFTKSKTNYILDEDSNKLIEEINKEKNEDLYYIFTYQENNNNNSNKSENKNDNEDNNNNNNNNQNENPIKKINLFKIDLKDLTNTKTENKEFNEKLNEFTNEIIFNSLPNTADYVKDIDLINIIKHSNNFGYFFFNYKEKYKNSFNQYLQIANKFKYLKEKIWFLHTEEKEETQKEAESQKKSNKNSQNVNLFYYENFQSIGNPTYFFYEEDINFNHINSFIEKKRNFDKTSNVLFSQNKLLDVFEYKNDIVFTNYFIVYFYNIELKNRNKSLFRKWIYLLEKTNYLLNKDEYNKIQIFKFDFSNNSEKINFPNDLMQDSLNCIYLYRKKNKNNDITYDYERYKKGPSLQFFENFLSERIPSMTIKFEQEEYQKYFEEIFYNQEMMEMDEDGELDDLEEELNRDYDSNPNPNPNSNSNSNSKEDVKSNSRLAYFENEIKAGNPELENEFDIDMKDDL
jgi:hypothetical protein